jgi:hypothetical protein
MESRYIGKRLICPLGRESLEWSGFACGCYSIALPMVVSRTTFDVSLLSLSRDFLDSIVSCGISKPL